ncbi:MAG: pantoate--beta-alanine ligase [bacterium]|nr:pantoate--beta-alanine ligase [bacterium]MCS7308831.1 pantoate--beta-alanine ligase [Armatimonadota bacterium]MDW8105523.1 pantoate--beta-alanine ligase [Armatimonadota bacterium]
MQVAKTVREVRAWTKLAREDGKTIGFVPTMGYFHEGHLSLMRRAKAECDLCVVSLFVNPTQFGPTEDYQRYPRDFARDAAMAESVGVDLLFAPEVEEMYPNGYQTYVEVTEVTRRLEGAARPGHFRGVATVCAKLFNIVQADRAYFGKKDYQQLKVIQRMVRDLNLPVEIVPCETVREPDGLAMSSRNVYLQPAERQAATVLYRALCAGRDAILAGERDAATVQRVIEQVIATEPLVQPEYVDVADAETLEPLTVLQGEVLLSLAARVGIARLIDNITVSV